MGKDKTPNKSASQKKPQGKLREAKQRTLGGTYSLLSKLSTTDKGAAAKKYRKVLKASEARLTASRKADARKIALNELTQQDCFSSTQVLGVESKEKKWICSVKNQLAWREHKHAVQEQEVRVFIEGAEVSSYLRDSITWSLQGTGGMNTCSFTLNNAFDAFILTPINVCSHLDQSGWRLAKNKQHQIITTPGRYTKDTDETAKYIIYRNKARRVFPPDGNKKNKNPQIDETGMWIYPLGPYRPIFHKHDCVRVFYKLPHISGVGKSFKNRIRYAEAWAPAFTGFIDEYDFIDDPVTGDRRVNIRCYDFRGILERMRVRILGTGLASKNQDKASEQSPIHTQSTNAADKTDAKNEHKKGSKVNKDREFVDVTDELGINDQLNTLFNKLLQLRIISKCENGKNSGIDSNCVAKEYDVLLNRFTEQIKKLKQEWKVLDKYVTRANQNDGRKRKYERDGDGPVKVTVGGKGSDAALDQVPKAIKFIQSTAPVILQYAIKYYNATVNAIDNYIFVIKRFEYSSSYYSSSTDLEDPRPYKELASVPGAGKYIGKTINLYTTDYITDVDDELKQKHPDIYAKANIEIASTENGKTKINRASIDRVYLLQYYMASTIRGYFNGVSDKVKTSLDKLIEEKAGGRTLLQKGKLVFGLPTSAAVSFVTAGGAQQVVTALQEYKYSTQVVNAGRASEEIDQYLEDFNQTLEDIQDKLDSVYADLKRYFQENPDLLKRARRLNIIETVNEAYTGGLSNAVSQSEGASLARLLATDAKFGIVQSGIYADLARAIEKDAHPLAGMSFEEAITWLTTVQSTINVGLLEKLNAYQPNVLQSWNMRMVFGVVGRAYSYREVSLFGEQCVTEAKRDDAPLSPLHAFLHMLLPKDGTGATTLVQQDITANAAAAREYSWETRLALINSLCETLDYQFYVTPIGDLAFEFPNYSSLPTDYGKIFRGAYTATMGIRSFQCTEETGECNTGWVLVGNENERVLDDITNKGIVREKFQKNVIVADILARRIGVKVRKLDIPIPGIGSIMNGKVARGLRSILAYGLLEIQRELGRMSTFSVEHEFRPYMLPNRPFHAVHRQRIGLARSISYTMNPPNGECNVSADMYYVRGLHEDGSFRHIAGGHRLPVDYSGLFTGEIKQTLTYGAKPRKPLSPDVFQENEKMRNAVLATQGRRTPKTRTNWSCSPYLRDRYIESGWSYSDQVGSQFRTGQPYTSYTSGSGGSAGVMPPTTRTAQGYLASRNWTKADNTGQPDSSIDTNKTGIRIKESGQGDGKQKPNTLGNLHNPWPYGLYLGKNKTRYFNQWGFFRMLIPAERTKRGGPDSKWSEPDSWRHKGKLTGWHGGVDFYKGIKVGTEAYTPIALSSISTVLYSGYRGGGSKAEWLAFSVGDVVASTPTVVKKFGILKDGGYITREASSGFREYLIDASAKEIYDEIIEEGRKAKSNFDIPVENGKSPKSGLVITGFGMVSFPGDSSKKLACRLRYVHTSKPAKNGKNMLYGSFRGYSPQHNKAPADSLLCYTGTSGTSTPHLHFAMEVYPPGQEPRGAGGKTDESAWKEIQKTNADFLRTQLKIKLTAGYGVNSGKMSDKWRRYFQLKNKDAGANVTTVDQAVDYLLKQKNAVSQNWKRAVGEKGRVETNPLFFFRPEQIIKSMASQYNNYKKTWGDIYIDISGSNTESSICGKTNALNQQKIALQYSACLGKARRLVPNLRKPARLKCKTKRDASKKQSKVKITRREQAGADRTERKLAANVKSESNKQNSALRSDS